MRTQLNAISILVAAALTLSFASCTDTGTSTAAAGGDQSTATTSRGEGRTKGTKGMTSQRGELTTDAPGATSETGTSTRGGR
jgi:hypothetical protein